MFIRDSSVDRLPPCPDDIATSLCTMVQVCTPVCKEFTQRILQPATCLSAQIGSFEHQCLLIVHTLWSSRQTFLGRPADYLDYDPQLEDSPCDVISLISQALLLCHNWLPDISVVALLPLPCHAHNLHSSTGGLPLRQLLP